MATPHGDTPTGIRRTTSIVSVRTTLTSLPGPFAVYSHLPSFDSAIPHGRTPTCTVFSTESRVASITETVPPRPLETYARFPSRDTTIPIVREPRGRVIVSRTVCVAGSTTDTLP